MNNTKVRRFDGDCMELGDGLGKYVLYSDYAALEAERDARDQESIERGQRIASLKEALERCSQERNRQALEAEVQKLREACKAAFHAIDCYRRYCDDAEFKESPGMAHAFKKLESLYFAALAQPET